MYIFNLEFLGPTYTTTEEFEPNAALLLRFDLTSTLLNPSPKRSFSKTLFKSEEFENAGVFARTGNTLKMVITQ